MMWQHLLAPNTDDIQKPANSLEFLLGEVRQPNESRLNQTRTFCSWGKFENVLVIG